MSEMIKALSDREVMESLTRVLGEERAAVSLSIGYLIEITSRDLPARLGYPSLFAFLSGHCKLSESAASKRGAAVGVARRFPEVLTLLAEGRLHLSNLSLVARHVTGDNRHRMIEAACDMSHRELEGFLARFSDRPVATREVVKAVALAPSRSSLGSVPDPLCAESKDLFARPESKAESTPVEIGLRVSITLEGGAKEALEDLRRQFPGKSITEIVTQALIKERDRTSQAKKLASTTKPGSRSKSANPTKPLSPRPERPWKGLVVSRYIPAAVKREVFARDGGRCGYVSPDGRRCNCRTRLEFDHVTAFAAGGKAEVSNLRLRCKVHNLLYAKDVFGKSFVEANFTRGR